MPTMPVYASSVEGTNVRWTRQARLPSVRVTCSTHSLDAATASCSPHCAQPRRRSRLPLPCPSFQMSCLQQPTSTICCPWDRFSSSSGSLSSDAFLTGQQPEHGVGRSRDGVPLPAGAATVGISSAFVPEAVNMASLASLKTHMVHKFLHHLWITGNTRFHFKKVDQLEIARLFWKAMRVKLPQFTGVAKIGHRHLIIP
ncbi:hypothetical protein EJB05_01264, partial [Eragrostis curvula]